MTAQPGEDVVVIHIAGGPVLVLHPENARDLMAAQSGSTRGEGSARESGGGEIRIPGRLQWAGLERGLPQRGAQRGALGDVVLSAVEIVTGVGKSPAANFVASEVVRKVDAQVNAGVYSLSPGALTKLKGAASPYLKCLRRLPPNRCWCSCTARFRKRAVVSASCGRSIHNWSHRSSIITNSGSTRSTIRRSV
jgi:hypothetical protein